MSSRPATAREARYLDKATLVRAAADIADREGWENLTLSQVAKAVDRHVTSLYAHVEGLDALRREVALLVLDELADEVWRAALGRSRDEALIAIATVERSYAVEHPGRHAALLTFRRADDDELNARGRRLAEPVRATFRSFGLDDGQVAVAHSLFSSALRGLVLAERTDTFTYRDVCPDEALAQLVSLFGAALSTGAWPGTATP
ncbi:MAG TPA: TetR/AcrR family transcriptional regulator [Acidimicrobiales bacterium]|nr:TetR/AcrR family transcriptional regulator [Acidimicrobiales bacterium]